jgi:hypothetical protein
MVLARPQKQRNILPDSVSVPNNHSDWTKEALGERALLCRAEAAPAAPRVPGAMKHRLPGPSGAPRPGFTVPEAVFQPPGVYAAS